MASSAPRSFKSSLSGSSGRFGPPKKPFGQKQVMVSEADDPEVEDDEPVDGDKVEETQLEEVLKCEAEALAAELDEAAAGGVGDDVLRDLEESVESAAEALLTMREAKTRLQEVKKDRGFGKASTSSTSVTSRTESKKLSGKHPCFDCGEAGHWAGDPQCSRPGAGLARKTTPKKPFKQVKVVEACAAETTTLEENTGDGVNNEVMAVMMERPLSRPLVAALEAANAKPNEVNAASLRLTEDKRLVGALDSACNRTCSGPEWLSGFMRGLRKRCRCW